MGRGLDGGRLDCDAGRMEFCLTRGVAPPSDGLGSELSKLEEELAVPTRSLKSPLGVADTIGSPEVGLLPS